MRTTPDDSPAATEDGGERPHPGLLKRVADRCLDGVRLVRRAVVLGQLDDLVREMEGRGVRVSTAHPDSVPAGPFDLALLGPDAVCGDRDGDRRVLSDLAASLRLGGRAVVMTGDGHDAAEYGRLMQGAGFDPPDLRIEPGAPGGTLLVSRLRLWRSGRIPSGTG